MLTYDTSEWAVRICYIKDHDKNLELTLRCTMLIHDQQDWDDYRIRALVTYNEKVENPRISLPFLIDAIMDAIQNHIDECGDHNWKVCNGQIDEHNISINVGEIYGIKTA